MFYLFRCRVKDFYLLTGSEPAGAGVHSGPVEQVLVEVVARLLVAGSASALRSVGGLVAVDVDGRSLLPGTCLLRSLLDHFSCGHVPGSVISRARFRI